MTEHASKLCCRPRRLRKAELDHEEGQKENSIPAASGCMDTVTPSRSAGVLVNSRPGQRMTAVAVQHEKFTLCSETYVSVQAGMYQATGAGDDLLCLFGYLCQTLHHSMRYVMRQMQVAFSHASIALWLSDNSCTSFDAGFSGFSALALMQIDDACTDN